MSNSLGKMSLKLNINKNENNLVTAEVGYRRKSAAIREIVRKKTV
jgi:hypothetical protein